MNTRGRQRPKTHDEPEDPYVVLGLALIVAGLSYRAAGHAVDTVSSRLLHETVQRIGQAVERHVVGSGAVPEAAIPQGLAAPADIRTELPALRSRLWIATTLHRDPNNYAYYGNRQGQAAGLWRFSETDAESRVKLAAEDPRTLCQSSGSGGALHDPAHEQRLYDPRLRPCTSSARRPRCRPGRRCMSTSGTTNWSRRVNGADGRIEGVVATDLSLRAIEEFVRGLQVAPNGLAFVVERNGDLVAASNTPNVVRRADGAYDRLNAANAPNPLLVATYRELRAGAGAAVRRSRCVQGRQRPLRPQGRRHRAGGARRAAAEGRARQRHGRPLCWRRIHRAARWRGVGRSGRRAAAQPGTRAARTDSRHPGGATVTIGGSIGLALYPRDGNEARSVIAAADADM